MPVGGVTLGLCAVRRPSARSLASIGACRSIVTTFENFLAREASSIRGRVLEVGDNSYTQKFGGSRVTGSDVLHIVEGNPQATEELRQQDLEFRDPEYEVLLTAKGAKLGTEARKTHTQRSGTQRRIKQSGQSALILLYHRIAKLPSDPWSLCVTPEQFSQHFRDSARAYQSNEPSTVNSGIMRRRASRAASGRNF